MWFESDIYTYVFHETFDTIVLFLIFCAVVVAKTVTDLHGLKLILMA